MLKIVLILSLVCFTYQNRYRHTCRDLNQIDCENSVGCFFDDSTDICQTAEYELLGHRRDTFSQYMIFDSDVKCDNILNTEDFVATQSFKNSKHFKSFCGFWGVHKIQVAGNFYRLGNAGDFNAIDTRAIIYPKAEQGCLLAFSKKYYRGSSWNICRPTKLNGQRIRSIMPGDNVIFSLYDNEGRAYPDFQLQTFGDAAVEEDGFPDIDHEHLEYILVQFDFTT